MATETEHGACVDAWLNGHAKDLSRARLIELFEESFAALWRRAQVTLGSVTLVAIVDRVLHNASQLFPALSALRVDPAGIHWKELMKDGPGELPDEDLVRALRFVLVEFLRVLGSLTADILTPALHAELLARGRGKDGRETK